MNGFRGRLRRMNLAMSASIARARAYVIGSPPFHSSTNDIEYSLGAPTAKLAASIGIGTDKWNLSLSAGLSLGTDPYYDYHRPDSDGGGPLNPELTLVPNAQYTLGAGFSLGF